MEERSDDSDAASGEDSDTQDSDSTYSTATAMTGALVSAQRPVVLPRWRARNAPITIMTDATAANWGMMIQDNVSGTYQIRRFPMGITRSTTSVVREIAAMIRTSSMRQHHRHAVDLTSLDTLESGASDEEASADSEEAM